MIRRLTILAALAAAAFATMHSLSERNVLPSPFGQALAQDAKDIDTSMIKEMTLGNPDAAVTVIEYASFTCPHCATFHAGPYKQLKAEYIDSGLIDFVYREVYFDRFGLWAGITARCGENAESRYFGIVEMLYEQQQDWAGGSSDAQEIVDKLRRIGKTAGLTDADLDGCFTDGDRAQALYALYLQNAEADGIRSTPSFVIDGKLHGNMSYADLKALIDEALGG
ncbi:MAG: DsbA family protein [Boseongicola sp. SB0664_bin_43]|uniref:DsbA family protein n=1 Tax=Boseongicola sp. SB0664_bin_43 TaxID=2604844 RepID=A0A6B0XW22_9RHOB|nr:DsbA family protein [Boseongicola sp. SB0664_bin_43]MYK32440.1 DsbA family protein [Boseongicola sp. SB0670_bin_30]